MLLSLICAALAAALLAWLVSWPLLAVVAMFLLGAMGTPAGIAMSTLLDITVPSCSSKLTVAYTSMIATNLVAVSLGSAAGGTVIDLATPTLALVIAVGSVLRCAHRHRAPTLARLSSRLRGRIRRALLVEKLST